MNRDELYKIMLTTIMERCEAARLRPKPPAWNLWAVQEHEFDLKYGPEYRPSWFGRLTESEAGRIRILRFIYSLTEADLLHLLKSRGGRFKRVRLTAKGLRAARSLERARK
jgi:hypothetical protein